MYGLAIQPLVRHTVAHAPVLSAYLQSAALRGREISIAPGPGTVGARTLFAGKDVVGSWARRVIAQSEFPLARDGQGVAVVPQARSFRDRLSGVMLSVIKGERVGRAPKSRTEMLDEMAPVAPGQAARSAGLAGYETRAQSERRDVAALVTLGGVAFNLDQMPGALRSKIEFELSRAMTHYKRVALTPGRINDLSPYQLHAILTLGVLRAQQALGLSNGRRAAVDIDAIDARVITDDGSVAGEAFEELAAVGPGALKATAAATVLAAGMGAQLNELGDAEVTDLHAWMEQNSQQYEAAIDEALDGGVADDRRATSRPELRLADRDEPEAHRFNPTPFPSMAYAPRPGA